MERNVNAARGDELGPLMLCIIINLLFHSCYLGKKTYKQNIHEGLKDNELVENSVDVIITLVFLDPKRVSVKRYAHKSVR